MRHWLAVLLWLPASVGIAAAPPEELLRDGSLRARVVVESPEPLYQRSAVIIAVEIATPRWFSRGTRVRDFRIPGAVVRPVSSFADNQSRREAGQSWSVQRWRYRVFPREAGELALPPLRVFVSVNSGDASPSEGELTLSSPVLRIDAPPGSDAVEDWVASPSLTIEERWEGLQEQYRPGDALVRHRRFRVADTPAMMLPDLRTEQLPGLSLYSAPPTISDRQERGALTGIREEKLVITIEAPGDFAVPGSSYHWFNTDSGEFERIDLPALDFSAAGAVAPPPGEERTRQLAGTTWKLLAGLLLAVLLLLLARRSAALRALRQWLVQLIEARRSRQRYLRLLDSEDSRGALQLLHRHLARRGRHSSLHKAVAADERLRRTLRSLLAHAYGGDTDSALPDRADALLLWQRIASPPRSDSAAQSLQLNPPATG